MQQPYPKLGAAGKLLNQKVRALVNDPFFRRADFDRRRSALMKAVSQARQFAKFQVMQERRLRGRTPRIPTGRERRLPNTLLEEVRQSAAATMKRSSKPKLPQGITKRELAEAHKEMVAWERRLKSKDESQVLRALIHLTDLRDGKVPLSLPRLS